MPASRMPGSAMARNKISRPLYFRMKPKNKMIFSSGPIFQFFLLFRNCLASVQEMISPKLSYRGWMACLAGLFFSNSLRSFITASLIVTNASQGFRKYLVKALSPGRFSCGNTLSVIATTLVLPFFFALLKMVPRAGPMNGSQYRTTISSGISFFSLLPMRSQLNGLMELITECIKVPTGGASVEYWVVPGNKNPGYCNEKE